MYICTTSGGVGDQEETREQKNERSKEPDREEERERETNPFHVFYQRENRLLL